MSDGIELTDEEYDTFMAVLAEQRCQHSHADTVCPPPPERAILTDLIKELRHRHTPYRVCMECDDWYAGCEDHEHITVCLWCCTSHGYHSMDCADNHTGTTLAEHCVTVGMADRAEARMKGLFDE